MSKTGKAFKAIWWILRKPALLNRVLGDEDTWRNYIGKKHQRQNGLALVQMDQLIGSRNIELGPMSFMDGGSLPTDLMLLAGLAEQIKDCKYFEIGTWRGESVATVATRSLSCHTLSLSEKEMERRGIHPRTIKAHGLFSKELDNVIHLEGDSRHFDFGKLNEKYDLIFIDGDHHYDFVKSDTAQVFKHLVHDKSIVVWHDYGFHPDRIRYEVMAAILDGAGPERAAWTYHVAHTKCAIYTGYQLHSRPAEFPVIPEAYFNTRISGPLRREHGLQEKNK